MAGNGADKTKNNEAKGILSVFEASTDEVMNHTMGMGKQTRETKKEASIISPDLNKSDSLSGPGLASWPAMRQLVSIEGGGLKRVSFLISFTVLVAFWPLHVPRVRQVTCLLEDMV